MHRCRCYRRRCKRHLQIESSRCLVTLHLQSTFFIMSDSDSESVTSDAQQLYRQVFTPLLLRLQAHPAAIPKRQRPLYGYNFSPPSTPNGNHTIAQREQMRKEAAPFAEDEDYQFTPRCLLQHTIKDQQCLLRSTDMTPADWNLMASCLSPFPPPKLPRPPCIH